MEWKDIRRGRERENIGWVSVKWVREHVCVCGVKLMNVVAGAIVVVEE